MVLERVHMHTHNKRKSRKEVFDPIDRSYDPGVVVWDRRFSFRMSYLAHNAELRRPPAVVGEDNRIETPNNFLQEVSQENVANEGTEEP